MKIDWSKAPEGTTGAVVAQFGNSIVKMGQKVDFVKAKPSEFMYWQGVCEWLYVARPHECSNKGLPLIGTICVYSSRNSTEPTEVKIIAHFSNHGADVAVFIPTWEGPKTAGQAIAECFRPIRTPEQIAAEALQIATQQIMVDAGITDSTFKDDPEAWVWAAALHEAGYRKQVQP